MADGQNSNRQVSLDVIVNDFINNIILTLNLRALVKVYNDREQLEAMMTDIYAQNWEVFSNVMNKYFATDLQALMTIKVAAQESYDMLKQNILSAWDEEHQSIIIPK